MVAPSSRLLSKLHRRSPSPPLFRCLSTFTSSSSPYSHHFVPRHQLNQVCGHHLRPRSDLLPPHICFSFCRRFSTQPEEPLLPIRVLISLLDSYHDHTGLPWWIIISSSTLAMRVLLFPLLVLQLKKLKRIGEFLPKLPPPLPPPLSGRSFKDQITFFSKEKQAAGCPSFFWFFASFSVQVPCFLLWIMSIRRMSLEHHSGFDCGGTLWFPNLTEYSNGVLGPVFPLLIAGLHYSNVQISIQKSSFQELPDTLGSLAKGYEFYLQLLTLPILFITFNVPQGSLVYWFTNSSLTLIQKLCLKNPSVLKYLGLPVKKASVTTPINDQRGNNEGPEIFLSTKQGKISAENLSPKELVAFSVKVLTDGHKDAAIKLLRLALKKDPGCTRALLIMGQTLLQKQELVEASLYLESAVSKFLVAGHPVEVEELDLLILSSQWAGIACMRQGKMDEGLFHLERLAQLTEPEDLKTKSYYYDGLVILASALLNMGRKAEALKHLSKAAAYSPAYLVYLKQCEEDSDDFANHLAKRYERFVS
ncbi:ALBINO3-like protein 3, mitochondrial [Primulina huaijiensis]|uniref:ALBINO3-like protein 3, mitochondrial n=1 Tax=Primulina huaijiensis TaxID=1492673 RepID=UPI003CC71B99